MGNQGIVDGLVWAKVSELEGIGVLEAIVCTIIVSFFIHHNILCLVRRRVFNRGEIGSIQEPERHSICRERRPSSIRKIKATIFPKR